MKAHRIIPFLFWTLILSLQAGPRLGTPYSVATDVLDSGGQRTTSTSYVNQGSIGTTVGTSSVASLGITAKHGYLGQLYQVTGVKVSASPTTLNEGTTLPLNAIASLDDTTFLLLQTNQVVWSVVSGPIKQISISGLAAADMVYQNTAAIVQAGYGPSISQLTLTVVDIGIDNFGSYAGDSIPDSWQVQYFGLNNNDGSRNADPDADGQDNYSEYVYGTVPTDPNSRFRIGIAMATGYSNLRQVTFTPWTTNRVYLLECRTNLVTALFETITNAAIADLGSAHAILDTNATQTTKFYRIRAAIQGQ